MSSSVFKSARLISILTLISRILGLLRDRACGRAFGIGAVWSAFSVGFQVPNLFRRLFGEGALSAASIPVLTEVLAKEGRDAVDDLAGKIMGLLTLLLVVLTVLGEGVVGLLYWRYRFDPDTALSLQLTALMLPYMVLVCGSAMLGGIQNVFDRFASAAASPIVMNVLMIAGALGAYAIGDLHKGAVLLSLSVVVSGVLQVLWQWAAIRRCGLRLRLRISFREPAIRRIFATMLPMVIGLGAVSINTLMDSLIAWWMVPGRVGPGILAYAQRLYQFPLGVFAIALATAIFPTLSRHAAERDMIGLSRTLSRGLRMSMFEGLPCMFGLIVVREPLVRTLFETGKFAENPDAVLRVSAALLMFSLGIWAYGVNQIITRAFYALQDSRTPLRIAVQNVVLNLALNLLLVRTSLRESGLALSTSICAAIQVFILLAIFHRRYAALHWDEILNSTLRVLVACAVMCVALFGCQHYAMPFQHPLGQLTVLVLLGAAIFLAAAWLLRIPELREVLHH